MKGILNYSEYKCPCDGQISRRKHDVKYKLGFFKVIRIYQYYYECDMCGKTSELFEIDVTDRWK